MPTRKLSLLNFLLIQISLPAGKSHRMDLHNLKSPYNLLDQVWPDNFLLTAFSLVTVVNAWISVQTLLIDYNVIKFN